MPEEADVFFFIFFELKEEPIVEVLDFELMVGWWLDEAPLTLPDVLKLLWLLWLFGVLNCVRVLEEWEGLSVIFVDVEEVVSLLGKGDFDDEALYNSFDPFLGCLFEATFLLPIVLLQEDPMMIDKKFFKITFSENIDNIIRNEVSFFTM